VGNGPRQGALVPWWWRESPLSVAASAVTASEPGTRWQKLLLFLLSACPAAVCVDPVCFHVASQGQLEGGREEADLSLSLEAFQPSQAVLETAARVNRQLTANCPAQQWSRMGAVPWMGISTSQYLAVRHSLPTSSACQPEAPPGTADAGSDEIQGQCSLMLTLHCGKGLAAWSVNKMLNSQPLIYCAAC